MTRREAARRGAVTGALWSAALSSLLAAVRTTGYARGGFALAYALFDWKVFGSTPLRAIAAVVLAAAVVGAAFGLLARWISAPAGARAALLALASLPAPPLVLATALTIVWVPTAARESLAAVALVPGGAFLFAVQLTPMALRVAVPAAILAALMLEGWTRPESRGRGGLANPRARRLSMQVLVAVTVALTTFAALRWDRVAPDP
jgi:hypothetical protein